MNDTTTESGAMLIAKLAPPASVTAAGMVGMQVSELLIWVTLVYTGLMIVHKLMAMYRDASTWWRK